MSNAFWALQGLLLLALVVTAVRVELDRRRDERASTRRVPVERRRAAARSVQLRPLEREAAPLRRVATVDVGLGSFTLRERARLLLLRGSVQDAKTGRGGLHDDLEADESTRWVVAASARVPPAPTLSAPASERVPPPEPQPAWTARQLTLAVAAVLLIVGAVGVVRTNADLQASEVSSSLAARLVPGLLANPGKYVKAVNSSASATASLDQVSYLQQKQAMDRWEAVLVLGAALLLTTRRTPSSAAPTAEGEAARESSVANDLLPFLFLVALVFGALSFFELP